MFNVSKASTVLRRFRQLIILFPRASRYPYLVGSIIPVTLGALLSLVEQNAFDPWRLLLTVIGICAAHLSVNLFNDYFDHRYGVDPPHPPRPFSGGSQVIQEGLETPAEFLGQALVMAFLAAATAAVLAVLAGPFILLFAALGGFLGYFYSARPLALSWRGLGEIAVGLSFGPLAVAGSHYVQSGIFSPDSLFFSLVPGALMAALLFVNQYPDYHDDRRAGKKTIVVRKGPRGALPVLYMLLAVGFTPLLLGRLLSLPVSHGYLALVGLVPASLAAGLLAQGKTGAEESGPGRLMLICYTVTLSLLTLSIFLPF